MKLDGAIARVKLLTFLFIKIFILCINISLIEHIVPLAHYKKNICNI